MAGNGNGMGKIGAGGRPLPDAARAALESQLGADLSQVRVLNNSALVNGTGAQAYTVGSDIHFATGAYSPDTPEGRKLLAHELAHVVQQK